MFKWNRLLRKNKSSNYINNIPENNIQPGKDVSSDNKEEHEIIEMEILPAKIICPDCGGITLEGLEFCDKCGGEL